MKTEKIKSKKTIFRAIFFPMFAIMLIQSAIFFFVSVYAEIEINLQENTTKILNERLNTRNTAISNTMNYEFFNLDNCIDKIQNIYQEYENSYGDKPLIGNRDNQVDFLLDCSDYIIDTLRQNSTSGIFMIINDKDNNITSFDENVEVKYGICIRDSNPNSNYSGRSDLSIEKSPYEISDDLNCFISSNWGDETEINYEFSSLKEGEYYYEPLMAAWNNPTANYKDLAYLSSVYRFSYNDPEVIAYSVPLISSNGYPYGVVGVELTLKYLSSILPSSDIDNDSYIIARSEKDSLIYTPITGLGKLFTIYFASNNHDINGVNQTNFGGFYFNERNEIDLYVCASPIKIYNSNTPFENNQLILLSLSDTDEIFAYIEQIKGNMLLVAVGCLVIGVIGIFIVSQMFSRPIKLLAEKTRNVDPQYTNLNYLGIDEIDQLVSAIAELNLKANKTSARTEFFSQMSHDLRTPMNAIISFSSQEMLNGVNEKIKDDYLNKIHESGIYMLGLINEVLDMTKIESNNIELNLTTVPLNDICETAIVMTEELTFKKEQTFIKKINVIKDTNVLVDKQRVNQIVLNLLSNAVKFTPNNGKIELSITTSKNDDDYISYQIIINDNGIGMSESFLRKLYIPFEQENSALEGTGLGLSITQRLVKLMNGSIKCISKIDVGTTFIVQIPLKESKEETKELTTEKLQDVHFKEFTGKHVLVCEDNEMNAIIIENMLSRYKMIVEVAKNGQIGVDMFVKSDVGYYDIILMDVRMPVMDGLEASKTIRNLNRIDATNVPIIAMTADAFDEDMHACISAGMNFHLAKPINQDLFFKTLYNYIVKKS